MANKVFLMGRLTKDPDMRGEGTNLVARYSLAVDRRFKDNDGNYEQYYLQIKNGLILENAFSVGLRYMF